jgi:sugar/nucleoside kinase (ribokinase family)
MPAMASFDILVVGELNVDLILNRIQAFPRIGAEVLAKDMALALGSSSAIFACNAAAFGSRVAFRGKVGTDAFGDFLLASLRERRVEVDQVLRDPTSRTGATIAMSFANERAMVTFPGAMEELGLEHISEELLRRAKHLHVSSVFLQPRIQQDLHRILALAKSNGLTTSLDTQWDPFEKWDIDLYALLPLVDVFLPNESEVVALTKTKNVEDALASLRQAPNVVVVKLGREGSVARSGAGPLLRAAPFGNDQVVDAIGAGDSFDAGFVSQYIRGAPLERCLRCGNLAGALNTTAAGGTGAFSSSAQIRQVASARFGVDASELLGGQP